jgi:spoIIIJ-associated protein
MSDNLTQDHVTAEPEQDVEGSQESLESVDAPISESSAADDVDVDADVTDDAEDAEDAEGGDAGGDAPAAPALSNRRANLEREGEVAADFLETLLDICDLDGDIDVDIDGDRAAVSVVDSEDGRVPRRLVGPNGQVLEALQELTRLAVQSATGERSRLMLDVAGHRAERRATLVTLAKEAIDEVRATGERKPLSPMTAFERKVVHDEVLAAGLVSESEGAEPRRYVVILPA